MGRFLSPPRSCLATLPGFARASRMGGWLHLLAASPVSLLPSRFSRIASPVSLLPSRFFRIASSVSLLPSLSIRLNVEPLSELFIHIVDRVDICCRRITRLVRRSHGAETVCNRATGRDRGDVAVAVQLFARLDIHEFGYVRARRGDRRYRFIALGRLAESGTRLF